ncbi:phospholipase D delta isoform X1 [Amaranthus tricolor]|uniref:phospholipase D delta isoform X1 n=1 Tax=Amaranthus tricolor TaxID=29722 RepID=UPI0025909EB8|nr:phospholipase D delta isoform X1 [Amaranthus tricolor]
MAENPEKMVYLHGDLHLKIYEARHLPNMDLTSQRLRLCFTACNTCSIRPKSSSDHPSTEKHHKHRHRIITSDPYVTVLVPQATIARTRVIRNSQNPRWNEQFHIPLAHPVINVEFNVKDDDVFGAQIIGSFTLPASRILSGELISGWFPILSSSGKPPKPNSALRIEIKFTPCEQNPDFKITENGVKSTYFPLRKGGIVKLYQDAHGRDDLLPEIKLENGEVYKQGKCWEDICCAISEAHHLIYIVGWSVFHKVKLVREPTKPLPRGGDLTLGELLKYKSEEGVRVLLLVWDDKTSHSKYFLNTEGVMQTHDEETRKFFKHSSVTCVLSPRYGSSKLSYFKQQVIGNLFTHHQKCVLVDTQAYGNNRKITAFLGGIDLCDGRYDTPEHRLFHDLDTAFKDDFHNPTFPTGTKAPRQPWHDLHCRIDGPAAYDVLINFEQRWKKATKWKEFGLRKKMSHWHDDALIKIDRISWILSPQHAAADDDVTVVPKEDPALWVSKEGHADNWHIQVIRSIDSGSLRGFPKSVQLAKAQNLECAKNLVIDKSIQTAYIQAIRSAQHFIYIENQYFLGSSYAWPSYKNAGADNLIPMELALKISSKIRAKERFAVYVVIPMWPEGDPKSGAVQEILYWQGQTMEMMYGIVARELKTLQLTDFHPQDYLNFYCLGKREELPEELLKEMNQSNKVSDSFNQRRFMIYVHAKGMIVDDEYVIVGSANINQRSLAGTKDTEIAMGAYQPHHTWSSKNRHPRGQIYGYRTSLWAEHLGTLHGAFDEPESLECVRKVNEIAEHNWTKFTAETFSTLQGHLLKYPLQVDADGKVAPLPDQESFPDIGGKIMGAPSTALPDVLTT